MAKTGQTEPTEGVEYTIKDAKIPQESRKLVEEIARMTNESETAGGFTWELSETMSRLITSARAITGIRSKARSGFLRRLLSANR